MSTHWPSSWSQTLCSLLPRIACGVFTTPRQICATPATVPPTMMPAPLTTPKPKPLTVEPIPPCCTPMAVLATTVPAPHATDVTAVFIPRNSPSNASFGRVSAINLLKDSWASSWLISATPSCPPREAKVVTLLASGDTASGGEAAAEVEASASVALALALVLASSDSFAAVSAGCGFLPTGGMKCSNSDWISSFTVVKLPIFAGTQEQPAPSIRLPSSSLLAGPSSNCVLRFGGGTPAKHSKVAVCKRGFDKAIDK
mmetsp:Transcript_27235/g.63470  ORF Transcript_27235/g.63470 Transcript_27235/m.63470 type:complete len:257 (+) Transcript_27235:1323-2093(+)